MLVICWLMYLVLKYMPTRVLLNTAAGKCQRRLIKYIHNWQLHYMNRLKSKYLQQKFKSLAVSFFWSDTEFTFHISRGMHHCCLVCVLNVWLFEPKLNIMIMHDDFVFQLFAYRSRPCIHGNAWTIDNVFLEIANLSYKQYVLYCMKNKWLNQDNIL